MSLSGVVVEDGPVGGSSRYSVLSHREHFTSSTCFRAITSSVRMCLVPKIGLENGPLTPCHGVILQRLKPPVEVLNVFVDDFFELACFAGSLDSDHEAPT